MNYIVNKYIVLVSSNIQDLKGIGYEVLTDKDGNWIGSFYDGSFIRSNNKCSNEQAKEITKVAV